ncbi:hypothetical protein OG21DRAFT_1490207 [Imleria badia]|nr:hypothetical protein OG21DRAFT_1490207 [Imleria badia]
MVQSIGHGKHGHHRNATPSRGGSDDIALSALFMPMEQSDHGSDDDGLLDLVIPSPPPFSDMHSIATPIPDKEDMLDMDIPSPPPMHTSTGFDADYDADSLLNVCIPTPPPHPEEDVEMHHSGEDTECFDGEQKEHSAGSYKEQTKEKATDTDNNEGLWALNVDEQRKAIRKLEKHLMKDEHSKATEPLDTLLADSILSWQIYLHRILAYPSISDLDPHKILSPLNTVGQHIILLRPVTCTQYLGPLDILRPAIIYSCRPNRNTYHNLGQPETLEQNPFAQPISPPEYLGPGHSEEPWPTRYLRGEYSPETQRPFRGSRTYSMFTLQAYSAFLTQLLLYELANSSEQSIGPPEMQSRNPLARLRLLDASNVHKPGLLNTLREDSSEQSIGPPEMQSHNPSARLRFSDAPHVHKLGPPNTIGLLTFTQSLGPLNILGPVASYAPGLLDILDPNIDLQAVGPTDDLGSSPVSHSGPTAHSPTKYLCTIYWPAENLGPCISKHPRPTQHLPVPQTVGPLYILRHNPSLHPGAHSILSFQVHHHSL